MTWEHLGKKQKHREAHVEGRKRLAGIQTSVKGKRESGPIAGLAQFTRAGER